MVKTDQAIPELMGRLDRTENTAATAKANVNGIYIHITTRQVALWTNGNGKYSHIKTRKEQWQFEHVANGHSRYIHITTRQEWWQFRHVAI